MQIISSPQNPILKEIKSLSDRKHRDSHKKYFIEGKRILAEAFLYPEEVVYVIVSDSFAASKDLESIINFCTLNLKILYCISDKLFLDISDTKSPQGVMAVMYQRLNFIENFPDSSHFIILLDSLQDPGNVGTIIRTSDAAGADAIFISKGSVDIYNPKVIRSTMGSIFHLPIYRYDRLEDILPVFRQNDFKLFTTHLKGASSIYEADFTRNTAIVIGNEANGVSDELAEQSDYLVKIPMVGKAESLNASIAASLIIYECLRQRNSFF